MDKSPYEQLLELIIEADSWVQAMEGVPISYFLYDKEVKRKWDEMMQKAKHG